MVNITPLGAVHSAKPNRLLAVTLPGPDTLLEDGCVATLSDRLLSDGLITLNTTTFLEGSPLRGIIWAVNVLSLLQDDHCKSPS